MRQWYTKWHTELTYYPTTKKDAVWGHEGWYKSIKHSAKSVSSQTCCLLMCNPDPSQALHYKYNLRIYCIDISNLTSKGCNKMKNHIGKKSFCLLSYKNAECNSKHYIFWCVLTCLLHEFIFGSWQLANRNHIIPFGCIDLAACLNAFTLIFTFCSCQQNPNLMLQHIKVHFQLYFWYMTWVTLTARVLFRPIPHPH